MCGKLARTYAMVERQSPCLLRASTYGCLGKVLELCGMILEQLIAVVDMTEVHEEFDVFLRETWAESLRP